MPPGGDSLSICITAPGGIRVLDIFLYRDVPTRPLERHMRIEEPVPRRIRLESASGERFIVLIANSPAPFNISALQSLDGAEQLEMHYRDEDPLFPLMSGVCHTGTDAAEAYLTPLLCRVAVRSISNFTGQPLFGASVSLRRVNSHVQMLRFDGFRPVETVDSPAWAAHPEMLSRVVGGVIGEEEVYPDITLFCYPFDGDGPSGTLLVFSAESTSGHLERTFALPPVSRGSSMDISLCIK